MSVQRFYQPAALILLVLIAGMLSYLLYDAFVYSNQEMDELQEDILELLPDEVVEEVEEFVQEIRADHAVAYPSETLIESDAELIGVTFGNGTGVQIVDDAVVTVHTVGTKVLITRHAVVDGETVLEEIELYSSDTWVAPGTLSESENVLLATFNTRSGFYASFSEDGGLTWSEPEVFADTPVGAAVPTSCLWHEGDEMQAMFAWVAPEHQGDGGPLYIATYVDGAWEIEQVTDFPYVSSPSLACDEDQQSMMMRVERSLERTGDIDLYFMTRVDGEWQDAQYIMRGADPHLAACNGDYWVGTHDVGANSLHSSDGGETWEKTVLSKTGKFGSIACEGDVVAISWGQWPSLGEANSKASTRSVGAQVSFDGGETWEEWLPAGDAIGQQISMVDVRDGVIVIFWRSAEGLHLKTYN